MSEKSMEAKVIYLEDYFSGHVGDERDQHLIIVGNKNLHIHQEASGILALGKDSYSGEIKFLSDKDLEKIEVFGESVLNVPEGVNEDNYSKHRTFYSFAQNFDLTEDVQNLIGSVKEKSFNTEILPTGTFNYSSLTKHNCGNLVKKVLDKLD